jgi:D-arabinose 1-dehydrogenase-like Zn-dependent alcohol dehydrogenase
VQVGAGAGAEATVPSSLIRGKMLHILGHTNFAAPPPVKREAYERLSAVAAAGELHVQVQPIKLDQVAEAWERLAAGSHRKIVLVP